ncbi:MAG: hypothetical protein NTX59_01850 [Elusimicrobia bacterium]|nr:hypothetical protein [Elusimicrobiota bacterium]
MKKTLFALVLMFSVNSVMAQESKDWQGWYNNLLKGLKTRIQTRLTSKTRVSAVAAVRGAKQGSDPMALYWKGGVSDNAQKKLDAEKSQFTDAVQLSVDGNVEDGRLALSKFIKDNPDSVFVQDAKEALSKLPAAEKAEVKPAPASAVKTENAVKTDKPAGKTSGQAKDED